MQHTVEKLSGNKVKISFKLPAASFDEAIDKAYLKMRGRINVPGFRKGKAPRKLIERMYGDMIFYDEALESLFPDAYMTAVRESDLKPVSRPEPNVQDMQAGQDLEFTCEVYVQPEVQLGEYKGVEVTRVVREISDDEVSAYIAGEQKKVARSVEITDEPVQDGDMVNLNYSGSVDGVAFPGGTAENQQLKIGSKSFIPGFEEQMIGLKIDEESDLKVAFPEQYHAEELKGKDAVFHVKVLGITREELPELDDEFASEVSEFDTLKEYTADVKVQLQKAADEQSTEAAKNALVDKVVEAATIELPPPMIEEKLDELIERMGWRFQQQGFSLKEYQKITGQTDEQMRDMYRNEAEANLKADLVLEELVKVENAEAKEEDVDKMLGEYATSMGQTIEKLKETFTEGQLDYFRHRAKIMSILDMLWEKAIVTDEKAKIEAKEETGEKTSEKSPAAPKKAKRTTKKAEETPSDEPKKPKRTTKKAETAKAEKE